MILKLKDILPNPYRDLKANPLIEGKILSLMDSINQTGFWDNVVVRKNAQGKYELAYGHHRLAAAIRAGLKEADFIVKELTDTMMIQIMDNENRETYGSTPASLIESVKAVVMALAKGTIPAFEIDEKAKKEYIRYAPSFVPGVSAPPGGAHPYTVANVALFLGRAKNKDRQEANKSVVAALNALHLKEIGRFSDALLVTKDRTGAPKPITTNELLRITSDIKRDVEAKDKSVKEERDKEQKLLDQKRKLEAEQKERAKKLEAKRQEALDKAAQARIENDKREVAKQKQRAADLAEKAKEKEVIDSIRISVIDAKVAETKKKQEEAQKAAEYSFVKRDVDCFLNNLESMQAGLLTENVKALAKRNLSLKDRQRVWEALSSFSDWVGGWAAAQFVAQGVPRYKKEIKKKK